MYVMLTYVVTKGITNANLSSHLRSGKRLDKPADCSDEM